MGTTKMYDKITMPNSKLIGKPVDLHGKRVDGKNVVKKPKEKSVPLIMWNKGNSQFLTKKDEIELIISKYNPGILAILEANVKNDIHLPALQINGYSLERDNLGSTGPRYRAVAYISNLLCYRRRYDLEEEGTPLIWLEVITNPSKPWLAGVGYRQWRILGEDKTKSRSMKCQLERWNNWSESCSQPSSFRRKADYPLR